MSQVLVPFVPPYWSEPAVGLLAQCLSLGGAKVLAKSQAGSLEKQAEWRFGNHVVQGYGLPLVSEHVTASNGNAGTPAEQMLESMHVDW